MKRGLLDPAFDVVGFGSSVLVILGLGLGERPRDLLRDWGQKAPRDCFIRDGERERDLRVGDAQERESHEIGLVAPVVVVIVP